VARTFRSDFDSLSGRARKTVHAAEQICSDTVAAQPYAVAAAALGVGFLLGGGVTRGMVTLLLGTGLRTVSGVLGRRVLQEIADYADAYGSDDPAEPTAPRARSSPTNENERNTP
jgi:hypothetical protein